MPYESKPMKKQWIEVEGKMTPIILPQIWSHEKQDWVVTSEQNPLPTQVTGSNVEELELENRIEVPAGTRFGPILVDVSDCKKIVLAARNTTTNSNLIKFTVRDCVAGYGAGEHIDLERKTRMVAQRVLFEPHIVQTEKIEVYFYNDEEDDYNFTLYVNKIK